MSEELLDIDRLEEFEAILKENKYIVINFFTEWSRASQRISPIFGKLSKEYPEAKFIKINEDKAEDICKKEKIEYFPTFLFYKEGNESSRLEGANEKKLIKKIKVLTGKQIDRKKGVIDTLKEYELLISSKKLVVVHFIPDDGGFEKLNEFFMILMADEKFKEIEFLIIDIDETKERKEIIEKAKIDVKEYDGFIFFKDGKEYSRFNKISQRLLIKNLEKLAGLPLSDSNDYPNTIEKYEHFIKENDLVCSLFLSEFKETCEEASNYFDQLNKDEEWSNVKFIKIYLEESLKIFQKEKPRDIPRFILYKNGKAEYNCPEEKVKINLYKLIGKPFPKMEGEFENLDEFEEKIKSNKLVVMGIFAKWYGPCKNVSLKFKEFSKSEEFSQIKFFEMDADNSKDILEKYDLKSLPSFLFYQDGEMIKRFSGENIEKLENTLLKLAGKPIPKKEGELLNVEEFESSIKRTKYAVVSFFSQIDKKSNYLEKIIESYKKYFKKVNFFKVVASNGESKEICSKYNFNKAPLFIYYENGKEVKRSEITHPDVLRDDIEDLLPEVYEPSNSKYHEHPLYLREGKNFICNCCNSSYWEKEIFAYYCKKCKYYLCEICMEHEEKNEPIEKKEIIFSLHHSQHPLVPTERNCNCDICGNHFDHSYCCMMCDFDLCEECHKAE